MEHPKQPPYWLFLDNRLFSIVFTEPYFCPILSGPEYALSHINEIGKGRLQQIFHMVAAPYLLLSPWNLFSARPEIYDYISNDIRNIVSLLEDYIIFGGLSPFSSLLFTILRFWPNRKDIPFIRKAGASSLGPHRLRGTSLACFRVWRSMSAPSYVLDAVCVTHTARLTPTWVRSLFSTS